MSSPSLFLCSMNTVAGFCFLAILLLFQRFPAREPELWLDDPLGSLPKDLVDRDEDPWLGSVSIRSEEDVPCSVPVVDLSLTRGSLAWILE